MEELNFSIPLSNLFTHLAAKAKAKAARNHEAENEREIILWCLVFVYD